MSNRAIQLIDWNEPINWKHPLSRNLFEIWMGVPGKRGFRTGLMKGLAGVGNGTLTNMDTVADWKALGQHGQFGGLQFGGTTDYVDFNSVSGLPTVNTTSFTSVHIFRKTDSSSGGSKIINNAGAASGYVGGLGWTDSAGRGFEIVTPANGGSSSTIATVEVSGTPFTSFDNNWHFVGFDYAGGLVTSDYTLVQFIIDGIQYSGAAGSGVGNTNNYRIGGRASTAGFPGIIALHALWIPAIGPEMLRRFYHESLRYYPGLLRRISRVKYFVPATGAFTLTADAATYTITGTDASLEQGYAVAADAASYSVTGTDASLEQGYAIAADGATYTVTGTDATLLQGYVVTADAASYAVSGTDVTLTVGAGGTFTLTADAASYTVTGTDASLFHGYVLTAYNTASAGFVATSSQYYTGTTIAFGTGDFAFACWIYLNNTTGVKTIVSLGSVTNDIEHLWLTVSGTSLFMSLNDSVQATRLTWTFGAGFSTGWNHIVVNFDRSGNATCWINGSAPTAPTVDISGHAAALNPTTFYVGRKVAGSDYFDGRIDKLIYTNAILDSSEIAELSAGAKLSNFSSGLSAKTVYGWEMEAVDGGTQTSAFTSNDLVPTNTPTQEEGYSTGGGSLFAITGTAASLEQGYSIAVDAASYTVTGTDATVEWNRVLSAGSATFTVTGTDVTLNYSGSVGFSLTAEGTQIVLNASNATLTYSALLNEFPELDFSTDYLIMDFPESVTYISTSQYGDTRYTVAKAIQAQPSHQERATSGGTYAGYDLTWLLPGVLMNTTPKISDVILDDAGTEWTIINAQYDQMDRMWNMQTVNLVLFFDLRDQIWLYKPDTASTLVDAAGRYTPTFTPAATLIPARIQEQRGDFSEERGKRGTQRTYQIFILEPITDITTEWYAQDTSGNKYDITGWTNKATITDLMTLEAVKRV